MALWLMVLLRAEQVRKKSYKRQYIKSGGERTSMAAQGNVKLLHSHLTVTSTAATLNEQRTVMLHGGSSTVRVCV